MGRKRLKPIDDDQIDVATPPPETADSVTAKEIKAAKAGKPSRLDRHAASVQMHIEDIRRDRKRLRIKSDRLQSELDELRPLHAALEEAHNTATKINVLSAVMIGIGGLLSTFASFVPNRLVQYPILAIGSCSWIWGLVVQVNGGWKGRANRH